MKEERKWEVLVKTSLLSGMYGEIIDDYSKDGVHGYEISAIRKDNKHGHKSWGWGDSEEKIILFTEGGNSLETNEEDTVSEGAFEWAEKITQGLCDFLNKET